MRISVSSHDELLAAVPHMFGFTPHESLVLYPFAPGLPRVRVDLPTSQTARDDVWESLEVPFGRHARSGSAVAIICLTTDRANAERASEDLRTRSESIDVTTPLRLWADDNQWCDLDSHESGQRTQAARARIDAQMVAAGHALPIASRSAMAAALVGDRDPIARLMPAARTASAASNPPAEHAWTMERLHRFHADGFALNDLDATRMLLAVVSVQVRDDVWENISQRTAQSHVALWTNLTRRAPDDVRAAPATLLSFASWIAGDGAKARCARNRRRAACLNRRGTCWREERAPCPLGRAFPLRAARRPTSRLSCPTARSDPVVRIKMGAVYLFATRGYAATTIRDICALVNLTTAGVYHHVENKESLLVELIRSGQQALNSTAETALVAARDPAEQVAVLVTSLTGSDGKNLMLTRVTDGELRSLDRSSGALEEILSLRDSYEEHWRAAIEGGVDSGLFSTHDQGLLRLAVMAMCTGTSTWFRPGGRKSLVAVCEDFVAMALTLAGTDGGTAAPRTTELVSLTLALMPTFEWEPSSVMSGI